VLIPGDGRGGVGAGLVSTVSLSSLPSTRSKHATHIPWLVGSAPGSISVPHHAHTVRSAVVPGPRCSIAIGCGVKKSKNLADDKANELAEEMPRKLGSGDFVIW
jgi:hypothetical protein